MGKKSKYSSNCTEALVYTLISTNSPSQTSDYASKSPRKMADNHHCRKNSNATKPYRPSRLLKRRKSRKSVNTGKGTQRQAHHCGRSQRNQRHSCCILESQQGRILLPNSKVTSLMQSRQTLLIGKNMCSYQGF